MEWPAMQAGGHQQQPYRAISGARHEGRRLPPCAKQERGFIKHAWRSHRHGARGRRARKANCPHKLFNLPGCSTGACSPAPVAGPPLPPPASPSASQGSPDTLRAVRSR